MPKVFEGTLTKKISFNIRADSEEEALFWLQTHDFADVEKVTTLFDVEYGESVEGEVDGDFGIDISTEKEEDV